MKKILFKQKGNKITSILDIDYDDKFTDIVKIALLEEKLFYKLQKKDFNDFVKQKLDKGWIENKNEENVSIIEDPIFGYILKDRYDNLSTSKYINQFKRSVNIELGNFKNINLLESIKYKRIIFCDFINKIDELIIKIQKDVQKYAKKQYKEIIEFYEGDELKLVKNSLKTPEGVFNNLIWLTHIVIDEKKIILSFECEWDEEHGMGISIVNWEIHEIGYAADV